MNNKKKYLTLGLLLMLAVTLTGLPEVTAKSSYLGAFNAKYGTSNTKLDTCDTCHVPGSNARNPYGMDLEAQLLAGASVDQALVNIEQKDSDGDKYSNIDEINARTFPGDASDYPLPPPPPGTSVTFTITDGINPIQDASVVMNRVKVMTDVSGKAVFTNVAPGDHKYTVSKRGYKRVTGIVSVAGDTAVSVILASR